MCSAACRCAHTRPPARSTASAAARTCAGSIGPSAGVAVERGQFGCRGGAGGQGGDDRQGFLAHGQVRASWFAGDGGVAPDADQVVDELEREADLAAEGVHRVDGLGLGVGVEGAEGAGGAE